MTIHSRKAGLLILLIGNSFISVAQKDIIIDDSLAAHSEKLKVKMGTQWFGKIWKFQFGEYGVVSSKLGWVTTSSKGNFLNTKTESKSTQKFFFVLANGASDSAKVNAATNVSIKSVNELPLGPHLSWGSDEVTHESRNFSAFITANNDTTEVWALLMNMVRDIGSGSNLDAVLTNADRNILIVPINSNRNGTDNRSQPALGYEFQENGRALCALQYYGGGMMGMNKNMVWLDNRLDNKMKLFLAAAMTAILQTKN